MTRQSTVADFVAAAREYVRRATGLELDGSVESLAYLDHYLRGVGEVTDEVLGLIATAVGVYFGEIVVAHIGGHWVTAGDAADWRVALDPAPGVSFSPAAMAAEAIREGEAGEWDATVSLPPESEGVVADALEAAGPVEADYYYSLTGRYETLEHIVEILVELRRRAHEAKPPSN